MDEYHMARRMLMAKVSGGRARGRPRLGWMDSVKVDLGNRRMTVEAACGGGCVSKRERSERVDCPGSYVTE